MSAVRTLVVWCPDWAVAAAGFGPDDPVVVVDGNVVVACSAAARSFGVRAGLRRREAQGRCPEAEVLAADQGRDARAFEPVVAALERDVVPAVETQRPGVCGFATRGPSRYFGGDEQLARKVHDLVADAVGAAVGARVGIADGVFAATLAARRGRIVDRGRSAAFVAPFTVGALGPARADLTDVLRRLGIRTLGDLAALPAHDVLARFGPDGAAAHRLANGLDERPLAARTPPPDLVVAIELDPPVERVDAAAFAGKALADDLHARLASRGLACARILVEAETEHGESLARLWRHDGALTPAAMAERVRWQLDGWLTDRGAGNLGGLTLLRLSPDETHADTGRQQGFWGGGAAGDRAARALARVQGLLGPDAVVTGVAAGGRSPGERASVVPWGDPREPPPARPPDPPWPGAVPPPSPATVHRLPVPAEVVDGDGAPLAVGGRGSPSGVPARLSIAGGAWAGVTAWAGPWLLDERWWDGAAHRRRARWQVVTSDGTAHLLFVERGRWSVEATYD